MGTFQCSEMCNKLCKASVKKTGYFYFTLSQLYPGLTKEERALVVKYPKKMLSAYRLSWKADDLCLTMFITSDMNDGSDACRHFIWAALLYKKFGLEFSQQILDAHEKSKTQPLVEQAMDMANNRLGLSVAGELSKKGELNEKAILQAFKTNLKKGSFVIIEEKPLNKKREVR